MNVKWNKKESIFGFDVSVLLMLFSIYIPINRYKFVLYGCALKKRVPSFLREERKSRRVQIITVVPCLVKYNMFGPNKNLVPSPKFHCKTTYQVTSM